jgi:hypothetical protein
MAARKSAKSTQIKVETAETVESKVVALAEQLGWFLGTVKGKADGLLASDAVRQEVARIRDGATELMEYVNRAGASAQQAAAGATKTALDTAGSSARNAAATVGSSARTVVANAATTAKDAVASVATSAKEVVAGAGTSAKNAVASATKAAKKAVKSATTTAKPKPAVAAKKRSGGTVDAPGKRHRKPPPQEKVNKRMGEAAGKKLGQKQFQPGKSARRG